MTFFYSPNTLRRLIAQIPADLVEGRVRLHEQRCLSADFWSSEDVRAACAQHERDLCALSFSRASGDLDAFEAFLTDPDLSAEARDGLAALSRVAETVCVSPEPSDDRPALVILSAGAGGEDARDFCQMTLREMVGYAEMRGLSAEVQDLSHEGAGLRDATLRVSGPNAFRIMRTEAGKRRLVRMSPYGKGGRQTSFCVISVIPEVPTNDVKISEADLRIETYRDTGPGGQHRNTTDSAVRITHLPTGISAKSAMRSQHENRRIAMTTLVSKIKEQAKRAADEARRDATAGGGAAGFGGHDRTIVMAPYALVRNEKTGESSADVAGYLTGGCPDVRAPDLESFGDQGVSAGIGGGA